MGTRPAVEKVDPTLSTIQPLQRLLSQYFQKEFAAPASGSRSVNSFQPNQGGVAYAGGSPTFNESAGGSRIGGRGPLDLPMFQGPYGAGPNEPQLDAIGAVQKMLGADPIVQTEDIRSAIERAGAPTTRTDFSNLNEMLANFTRGAPAPTDVTEGAGLVRGGAGAAPSSTRAIAAALPALEQALRAPRFDLTERFQAGEQVFQEDLDRILANVREEASGIGLGPGSTDRNDRLLRTAGTELNRFRLGQQDIAQEAFESAEQRRLGAVGQVPGLLGAFEAPLERMIRAGGTLAGIESIPFDQMLRSRGQEAALFPLMAEMARVPFQEDLAAAGQEASLLPSMLEAFGMPAEFASQLFGMGEVTRRADDTAIARKLAEFARTQGGGLQQILAFMGITPQAEIGFGPSGLSQFGSVLQGIGGIVPDFG